MKDVMSELVYLKYSKYNSRIDLENRTEEQILAFLAESADGYERKSIAPVLLFSDFCYDPSCVVLVNQIERQTATVYHEHDFFELNFVLHGAVAEYVDHAPHLLQENELLWIPPGVFHSCYPCTEDTVAYNILFQGEWVQQLCAAFRENGIRHFMNTGAGESYCRVSAEGNRFIREYILQMRYVQSSRYEPGFQNMMLESIGKLLLLQLTTCKMRTIQEQAASKRNMVDIAEVLGYISDHFSTVTLSQTAEHFGYTPEHLHRLIKKHTGSGFSTFIQSLRMPKAAHLLRHTTMPIYRIAETLGYSSSECFCRMFKKYVGVTPLTYRKENRRSNGQTVSECTLRIKEPC